MIIVAGVWTDLYQGHQRVLELEADIPAHQRERAGLVDSWKERLSFAPRQYTAPLPSVKPTSMSLRDDLPRRKMGDGGENQLIAALSASLDDRFYALQSLLVAQRLDVDVLVAGPTGVWVLESKDWSGYITVRDGRWSRQKWGLPGVAGRDRIQEKYGLPQSQESLKPFDRQWLREQAEVEKALRGVKLPTNQTNSSSRARGGLVFTHPRITLDFDGSCQASHGDIQQWVREVRYSPFTPEWEQATVMAVLDGLLKRSLSVRGQEGHSATAMAVRLYKEILDTL